MKTSELFGKGTVLSFEIFPPKPTADEKVIYETLDGLSGLNPDFISVTYGAGGGNNCRKTVRIASDIKHKYGIESIAHLPCINLSENDAVCILNQLKENEIENILALRGDISPDIKPNGRFHHANELIRFIYERYDFNIIAACYPEGHPEAANMDEDLAHLKEKVDAGCEYLTTQMFFDNNIYYRFLYKALAKGIDVPVTAGIMPVTNVAQVKRTISLTGNLVPAKFLSIVDRFGDNPAAMKQAGIAYATEQIIDLIANGVNHIHIYSMNKPDVAAAIMNNLSQIYVREQA